MRLSLRVLGLVGGALLTFTFAGRAAADVAPPEGYVEGCTVERVQTDGKACVACNAWHGDRDACVPLGEQGYTKSCNSRGASAWTEVWCKPDPNAKAITPPAPVVDTKKTESRGCSIVPGGPPPSDASSAGWVLVALAGLGLVVISRR